MSPPFPFMPVIIFFFFVVFGSLFQKTSAFCGDSVGGCWDITPTNVFEYPFSYGKSGDCGYPGLTLTCNPGDFEGDSRSVLNVSNHLYFILSKDYESQSLRVVGVDVDEDDCPRPMHNFTLPTTSPLSSPYNNTNNVNIRYFYNCSSGHPKDDVQGLPCLDATTTTNHLRSFAFLLIWETYSPDEPFDWYRRNCQENVVVPVQYAYNSSEDLKILLKRGFYLKWSTPEECKDCEESGGQCWFNFNHTTAHACSCPQHGTTQTKLFDKVCHPIQNTSQQQQQGTTNTTQLPPKGPMDTSQQNHHTGIRTEQKIIIGVCSGVGGVGGLLLIILFIYRQKLSSLFAPIVSHWKHNITNTPTNVEAFLEKGGGLGLQKHSYSQIKKMTNSFKETLGEGGFGSVFKGKLHDGRLVAVKVLNESKGKGDDFINEVATIGRTNHVNVVSLLGFCSTGPKQALVYEFMPNGSLEKFIYNRKNASITNPPLGWEKLYQIALGIAKGLEYLHCGCNTRILHFDIKPHNILLDQDFCPKISDFGLAKLCQARESNVSMHVARGTMGYIAPEVSCINFGRASHKSDVYSFGMMVFEMIGGRKNIDTSVENISEIYFPQWIYSHFKQDIDIDECREIFKEETTRKMIKVALWSIQPQPADRPSISKVVEMLEGNVDELEMPPNPFHDPP